MKLDTFTSLGMDTIEERHRRQALLEVGPETRETGPAVSAETRRPCAGSFCTDPEVILLSAVAAESVGIAVGSRCCGRETTEKPKESREQDSV